jgi:hypothetical protein
MLDNAGSTQLSVSSLSGIPPSAIDVKFLAPGPFPLSSPSAGAVS